jgi:hypothetical protein
MIFIKDLDFIFRGVRLKIWIFFKNFMKMMEKEKEEDEGK